MPKSIPCREEILSEDYRDFIVSDVQMPYLNSLLPETYCSQESGVGYRFAYLPKEQAEPVTLERFPYFSIPKCYGLLSMQALNQSGILPIQNQPSLQLKGNSVMIGFIDTGIDYENEVFRNLDGTTRIAGIWDQTIQTGTPPANFNYGSHYTQSEINQALTSENPRSFVPSFDENGHGTFLASIAAGSGNPEQQFLGAAPEATIACVKLKPAKQYLRDYYFVNPSTPCYQENDIILGMRYLHELALEYEMPLVFCIALGSSLGGRTGALPLAMVANIYSHMANRIPVIGTGNEANQRHHFFDEIMDVSDTKNVEVRVGENVSGFTMELWTDLPNILSISLTSPSGENTLRIPIRAGTSTTFDFLFEKTTVNIDYRLIVESTTSELIYFRFIDPAPGIWKLTVEPVRIIDGRFHIWLPLREFLTGDVFFLDSNPFYTLTGPSDAASPISVSYYDSTSNSIALDSGRGFTRKETIKPDFAAPGVQIMGAVPGGRFETRTGSSLAVGITCGAIALLLEWSLSQEDIPGIDTAEIKSLLILGAVRSSNLTYPNQEWGYGQLNLYNTFEEIRQL